jgi:hypothetical protein
MRKGSAWAALALALAVLLACSGVAVVTAQVTERIEGTQRYSCLFHRLARLCFCLAYDL